MRKSFCLAFAGLALPVIAQKVVQFDIRGVHPRDSVEAELVKRGTIQVPMLNQRMKYAVNVTIGTPGQSVQLQLDTGSTDVWVNLQNSPSCQVNLTCNSGNFNPNASSTYDLSVPGGFDTLYGDGTSSSGDLFTDVISVSGVNLTNQTMGLANISAIPYGLMGVGAPALEASSVGSTGEPYCFPNIIDTMVSQGKINSHAFSLYLNDLNATTGSILFGGVDTSRFTGPLTSLPMISLAIDGTSTSRYYSVAWTNLTITTPVGVETFWDPSYDSAAILDSGTSLATFPDALAEALFKQFGATIIDNNKGIAIAPCYLRTANATIDFTFGGPGGPILKVPVRELLVDYPQTLLGRIWHDLGGTQYCLVGFTKANGLPILLGDTILRSAYVVYDLDNRQIAIAQTNFNGGAANIQEMGNSSTNGIPNVSSTATAVTSISAASTLSSFAGVGPNGASLTDSGSGAGATSTISANSNIPLASFTTGKYTGQGAFTTATAVSTSSSSATSSSAASAVRVPTLGMERAWLSGLTGLFIACGAALFFL